ncbi:hypothetical protein LDC_2775 [sediment metagenome]|uniref:Uncharacterized protein n=1 Tax=sediment metagenome TaxID=749907 RepID=D9PMJ7_9ZZZZ
MIDSENIKLETFLDLKIKNNLLNLEVEFFIEKSKISINELQQYLKHKDSYLKKDNGTLIKIENEDEIKRLISIINKFKETKKTNIFEGKLYHVAELENIFANSKEYKIKYDNGYKKFLNEIELFLKEKNNNIMDIKIPPYLKKHLRNYQIDGVG